MKNSIFIKKMRKFSAISIHSVKSKYYKMVLLFFIKISEKTAYSVLHGLFNISIEIFILIN